MSDHRILVVEDEEDILELVRFNLGREGHQVLTAMTGEEGLELARAEKPDLILLDLMLPGLDGREVCRRLKQDAGTRGIPVVMVTARGEEADIVAGLEQGADDYVTKPFSPRVLTARVSAVLRRSARAPEAAGDEEIVRVHGLTIHPGRHEVIAEGERIDLSSTEFGILRYLARRPGWVFTRRQILQGVHGEDHPVLDRSIDVQIASLRRKLDRHGDVIETVRGVGYRFAE